MAEISSSANIQEKIHAVQSVVPNKSNHEIVLVLQQFDNNLDKAVQAFMDGSALQVLKEWNMTGKKKNSKRKRRKSKQRSRHREARARGDSGAEDVSLESRSGRDTDSMPSQPAAGDKSKVLPQEQQRLEDNKGGEAIPAEGKADPKGIRDPVLPALRVPGNGGRPRSKASAAKPPSPASPLDPEAEDAAKRRGPTMEKSVKDLQRCTVSLTRYRLMMKDEVDSSVRKIKAAFAELHNCLIDREVALMGEVDKVKGDALEILTARQKKAAELKRLTDLASQMAETQLAEIRAEIKHFVGERKSDEELGRSARFSCHSEQLKTQILQCGEISHPKNNYALRTPSSTHLYSATWHTASNLQSAYTRKSSSHTKTPDGKATLAKVSRQAVSGPPETSPTIPANKQNGSSSQRRRFHPQPHGIQLNSSLKSPSASKDTDQNHTKGKVRRVYRREPHNSFRPKMKAPLTIQEQSVPGKSVEELTCPEEPRRERPTQGPVEPRPLCSNVTRVSQCNVRPPGLEAPPGTPALSVPAVTLVA